ncbi:MAG: PA2169 family four-helix-bundle protein [Sphingobacteriales bacterium JAD_PAG50586_3]|nr:MAG: PA2169 family four-helix-bundle protein [Sphingobacteriales bacterium JAD_PAG50586_3]
MEIQGHSLSSKVNHLIAIAQDAKAGYANAANDTEDETLKKIFISLSAERDGYATQLENQLRILVGKTAADDEPAGKITRTWAFLKSALLNDDDDSIIMECIKGEELGLKEYAVVLENVKSDSALGKLLVKQRNGINSSLNGIKAYLNNR